MTRDRVLSWLAIGCAIAGLAASAASLVDSLAPTPAFCAAGGCATVRASAWARPFGVPLAALGLPFFAVALTFALGGPRLTRARRVVAALGGAGGLGLVIVQGAVIGAWCKLCLVADGAALGLAATTLLGGAWAAPGWRTRLVATAVAAVAVIVPMRALRDAQAAPPTTIIAAEALPAVVAAAQTPGQLTIVDFVDFECPFCRALHARLAAALAQVATPARPIRVVRKMVPLAQHPGALPAAIAWCCAEQQGQGDAMAEALIAAPTAALTTAGCERIAAALGLDLARYRADAASPRTRARIDADVAAARAAGIRALPTLYVGHTAFVGAAASVDDLVAALQANER